MLKPLLCEVFGHQPEMREVFCTYYFRPLDGGEWKLREGTATASFCRRCGDLLSCLRLIEENVEPGEYDLVYAKMHCVHHGTLKGVR